jgi:5S rRNA maturation endonuclease (ribonuclease M5)
MVLIMTDDAAELRAFKSRINLVEYAVSCGYGVDGKESSTNSVVLRRRMDNDKIIVKTDQDGHGVYFSVRDDQDNGTIVDFVRRRKGLNLGEVRKELRPWIGRVGRERESFRQNTVKPVPVVKDRKMVCRIWSLAHSIRYSSYLQQRGIDPETWRDVRFYSAVREDRRRNLIFPHYDLKGLCGYEIKNRDFTGFAPGGIRAVWCTTNMKTAKYAVIVESAIDALSHAQLMHTNEDTAYLSIGGQLSYYQRDLIKAIFRRRDNILSIEIGTDNDAAGHKLAVEIKALLSGGVKIKRTIPAKGKDWNNALRP